MSYEQGSKSLVDRLKENNQAVLTELENEPYRPVVYALTENQLTSLMALLTQAAEFQPELYSQIATLATREQIEKRLRELQNIQTDSMNRTAEELLMTNNGYLRESQNLLQQMRENSKQDGRSRDEYILKLSTEMDKKITALGSVISGLHRRILQIMCGTAVGSVLLSLVVCLLLRG